MVESVEITTEDIPSLATSKRSFEEVETNEDLIEIGKTRNTA